MFRSIRWLLLTLLLSLIPASMHAQIVISVGFAPPELPVYEQPICPEPNLMWMPGYWAWGGEDYYWVPGAWVEAPYAGALWTPDYWDWSGGRYRFHRGYWGRHVGYYGGVNYGFGYEGIGFTGGQWRGREFAYNTAVMRVNQNVIHTTYVDRTIVERNTIVNNNRVAYSGGPGGIQHAATPQERAAGHEQHAAPTRFQTQHVEAAKVDKSSYAKANGGRPQNVVAARPLGPEKRTPASGPNAEPKTAPQSHAVPAQRATPQQATPAQRAVPQQQAAPGQHATPAQRATPQQATPAQRAVPQQQAAPGQHATPAQRATPQQATPAQRAIPQQQATPGQHATPAQRATPQQVTPAQRAIPQQQARPAQQQQARPAQQQQARPAQQQQKAAPAPKAEPKPEKTPK
jgi:DNA segregation ATPase FtsK/SpoIIIE-like protein